jgi:hypothetical protein
MSRSGHDHDRQWHRPPEHCQTHFIVSGAAAKTRDFADRDGNPEPLFADDQTAGFAWVEIIDATMRERPCKYGIIMPYLQGCINGG